MFAPETWGEVDYFANLYSGTHEFGRRDQRALAGVSQHFRKALTFHALAIKLRPNLEIDIAQLDERGYTPAANSNELATVIEAEILELYSSVDCTVKILRSIYGPSSKGFKDSTRYAFLNTDKIGGSFPENLKTVLKSAVWFQDLCFLRDELTHLGTGSCRQDGPGGKIGYMHVGIQKAGKPLIVDDVFAWTAELNDSVNQFLGSVFRQLRTSLQPGKVAQFCGLVEGRMLMRYVDPTDQITFSSGECSSYEWFEKVDAPTCPFIRNCGAYERTRPGVDVEMLITSKQRPS
jgi:hypothetical protein